MNWKDFGITLADKVASFVGSWQFIIWQSIILIIWMFINVEQLVHFDPYPFILMNLLLSSQAAYATPMILMSSNRQATKDREELIKDLKVDENTNELLQSVMILLTKIEEDLKIDRQALQDHAKILAELKKIEKKTRKPKDHGHK
jgi:uncharacterized membrane protein